jgi:predicted anti-sigma-YlaC factor YlaD
MAESHDYVSCTQVVELVTDYLGRSLSPDAAALVAQHLNCCEGCVRYVDQIRTTIEALGRIEAEEVPPPGASAAAHRVPRLDRIMIAGTFLRPDVAARPRRASLNAEA